MMSYCVRLGAGLACLALLGFFFVRARQPEPEKQASKAEYIDAGKFASLQEALDAVPEGGGLVKLPPGKFVLTKPLVLTREDTRIEGAGAATWLVNENTKGEPALILQPQGIAKNAKARIWRVQLADFRISGNPKSGDGIRAIGVNEIYLSGMSIDHNGGHGVSLIDCYEDPRVCDSILTYNAKVGLHILRGHDIVVNANQFEENQDALHCIDSFNLCMNGNNLDDHLGQGVVIENTYGSVVSGNMIEECKGSAIILDRDCYGNTLSSNVIAHNGGGIELRDAWGCAVSANTFTINATKGLVVGPNSGRITITGNNFSNSHIGGKVRREDPAAGITLEATSDIVVSGNIFTGLVDSAVVADKKCQRVVITGNVMAEMGRTKPRPFPALKLGGASAIVEHNATDEQQSK